MKKVWIIERIPSEHEEWGYGGFETINSAFLAEKPFEMSDEEYEMFHRGYVDNIRYNHPNIFVYVLDDGPQENKSKIIRESIAIGKKELERRKVIEEQRKQMEEKYQQQKQARAEKAKLKRLERQRKLADELIQKRLNGEI